MNKKKGLAVKGWILGLAFLLAGCTVRAFAQDSDLVSLDAGNDSKQGVTFIVLQAGAIGQQFILGPGQNRQLKLPSGTALRLEYGSPPYQTQISALGSLNEQLRKITIRDDGDHIFIQEKISGKRLASQGATTAANGVISAQPQTNPQGTLPARRNKKDAKIRSVKRK